MKIFLIICLVSGLASSEKLDRSYLPPPGSKLSGGTLGDLDVPLEFPKQPTGPQLNNGKPETELGINRRPAPTGLPDSQKPGFTYFQNSYPVPKTTTSYAITQTTTFPAGYEINQPNAFVNGSSVQPGVPGQKYQQPIRGPGQGPRYNQYEPGQIQSTGSPYGTSTTARPPFPNNFNGLEYLPPVSNKQTPNQDDSKYLSNLPQGPKYQTGNDALMKQPGFTPGLNQHNQFTGIPSIPNIPSTVAPQYQDQRFGPTGPGSQQTQNQFPGSQFPSSTTAPQFQTGQRYIPGENQQNQFLGNQNLPSSTDTPQYQGQRLSTPGSNQRNQFLGKQDYPSSTIVPQFQTGQGFTTPGSNQQVFGARIPNQQNQFTGSQFPSSTAAHTPGSTQQNQYPGNQNYPSTAAPNYQDGNRYTTPGQVQGPGRLPFGSRVPSQNQYPGQTSPSSTIAPQFQEGERFTPGYVQEGYDSSVPTQQLQYPGRQNYLSSTTAPEYQTGQQFTTGPRGQNFPSTATPNYQNGQRYTTPGNQGQLVLEQQFGAPGQLDQNQMVGNQNYPSSTTVPQYQDNRAGSTPGSQQRYEFPQQNQYGNRNFPTSTTTPQYQQFSTPGQSFNQPTYPGSTAAPQYQQTLAPTPGTNRPGLSQQNQFQQPIYDQQIPSSTAAPQRFIPGSQPQFGDNNIPLPGTEVAFPQGLPGSPAYGNNQQPMFKPEAGSSIYGTAPSFSNQMIPSTTIGFIPTRDFTSTPGSGTYGGRRQERPQAEGDRNAEILNYENELTPEGYYYSYDTSNGIHADETGVVGNGTRAKGGYTYTGDDGKVYSVVYTADENGFQPRGDHLPTPPPIPEAIQRVIDQANMDKEAGTDDDGSYNEEKYGYTKYEGPIRLRPRNRTISFVNGVDIPQRNEDRIKGKNRNVLKPKSSRPDSKAREEQEYESEKTDDNESNFEEMEANIRISDKRPKPIKGFTAGDTRPGQKGTKTQRKPVVNSKNYGSGRHQISTEEYDDKVPNDDSEELEDNDDRQDSDGYDVDSDQVNYRDDPNNRTDFHGLNKYLPESKKTNRKNQSGKKRPSLKIDGLNKPVAGGSKITKDRYSEESQDTEPNFIDESRTRVPSRKNQIGQKVKDQSKTTGQNVSLDIDEENNMYFDGQSDTNEEYNSDDATKLSSNRKNNLIAPGSKNKNSGNSKRPAANKQKGVSINKANESSTDGETGYEYTPPQRPFGSEEATKFPSQINQNGAQTTVRPFLTKNVHGEENEPTDEYIDQYDNKPGRPMAVQKYPGSKNGGESYNQNIKANENEGFSTTRRPDSFGTSRRPYGRPQTTVTPYYEEQTVTGQEDESYQNNPKANQNQGFSTTRRPTYGTSQRPFGRPQTSASPQYQDRDVTGLEGDSYNQNNPEVNQNQRFSTTRIPSYGTSQRPLGRPQTSAPRYQDQLTGQVYVSNYGPQKPGDKLYYSTNAPNRGTVGNIFSSTTPLPPSGPDSSNQLPGQYQNRPTDGSYYEATSSTGETYIRPGQVPSTTYRPNYSFGDKTSAVTVDSSGRPIQSTVAPPFDRTLRPTYSVRPGSDNQQVDRFRPNEGRFGVTSGPETPGYQSTSAPIGEDFSGPKQPQRFDPKTGYHYK